MTTEKTIGRKVTEHRVVEAYRSIIEILTINDAPTLYMDSSLAGMGLAGTYEKKKGESARITMSDNHNVDEVEERLTIVHELTHFLLHREGYVAGAHGWPFIALAATLSVKCGHPSWDYVATANIRNWRGGANARIWAKHYLFARHVSSNIITRESFGADSADAITKIVMSYQNEFPTILPNKLSMRTHNYIARTDGIVILFIQFSVATVIFGVILLVCKIPTGFWVATGGCATFVTCGYILEYRQALKRISTITKKAKQAIASLILARLPWNKLATSVHNTQPPDTQDPAK